MPVLRAMPPASGGSGGSEGRSAIVERDESRNIERLDVLHTLEGRGHRRGEMMGTDQLRITLRRHRTGLAAVGIAVTSLALFALLAMGGPSRGVAAGPEDPADLSLTKSDSPDPVTVGAVLTYTILVSNAGPDPATNVVVTDDLPKQVDFVSATASSGSCQSPPGKGKGGKVDVQPGHPEQRRKRDRDDQDYGNQGGRHLKHGLGDQRRHRSADCQQFRHGGHQGAGRAQGLDLRQQEGHDRRHLWR